ncbi:hypothetical protein [Legionella micdadei]|uniref:Uncharacterized protein n=1 Tax=Legionella micdadei TaxID=451 RepID=A0A098GFC9_LEGMI|nr:hypothetical protein [Legionella micdadei]ARG97334.1 hypothetical protein B6N58_06485 [Legionella micdadei]ARH00357.1 hypothetical protein B6V88_07935 [Legionella micdadei]KTD28219.1 hypothetical protein Lmic_1330 [Legionella micdadei]NSL16848.1 hypothetical protein [Legionella micdadei]CEG61194.1 conserved exported protein of unknown function [Legionella micdadei]
MMKRLLITFCFLFGTYNISFASSSSDKEAQLCINAYNHLWFSFETIKSDLRTDPVSQQPKFIEEFTKVVAPDVHFEVQKLPVPPDLTSTISIVVDGITDLANTAAFGIDNYGEHHITSPFSIKKLPSTDNNVSHVYSMTTRDIDYTRNATADGGCTVYLSQKDVVCTIEKIKGISSSKKAILKSIIDNVVTAFPLPAPQCALWNAAPLTSYVD